MNLDGNKEELFIDYNKEDGVEEMMDGANQTANDENKESVEIEIVKEEINNPIDEN